jgi:hypothetical protein
VKFSSAPGGKYVASTFPSHGNTKLTMLRAYMTPIKQMFPSHGLPPAISQATNDRTRDFLFAPLPPNLRLMSEGGEDGYR